MILPSNRGHGASQPHASNNLDQYFVSTQSSLSSLDSVESQHEESPSTDAQDLWFTDFVLYDEDDHLSLSDVTSVLDTSGSVREDLPSGMTGTSLFTLSSTPDSGFNDSKAADTIGSNATFNSTGFDNSDLSVTLCYDQPDSESSKIVPGFHPGARSHSESVFGTYSDQFSPDHSVPAQNDSKPQPSVPRLRTAKCPTCNNPFSSEYRLSEHLKKCHSSTQFKCKNCTQGFRHAKDLKRHQRVHEPRKVTCSCGKKYARHDGLLRHFTNTKTQAGLHKAAELSSE